MSGKAQVLWWCLILSPPINMLFGLSTLGSTSPDLGGGAGFLTIPIWLVAAGCAFMITVDAIVDRPQTIRQRAFGILLALAVVPMFLLDVLNMGLLGYQGEEEPLLDKLACVVANGLWTYILLDVRRRYWGPAKQAEGQPARAD